jgi:HK97 family phage major capsid protein
MLYAAPVATDDDASPLRAFGTLEFVPLAPGASPSGVITPDGLVDLVHGLRTPYWPNAKFIMSRRTAGYVRKLKDPDNRYIWEPSYQAGQPPTLLGFPVYLVDQMAPIALNAIPILFGDFQSAYLVLEKQLRVTVDNVTSPGFVKLHIRRRVSGALVDDYAIKAGKCVSA